MKAKVRDGKEREREIQVGTAEDIDIPGCLPVVVVALKPLFTGAQINPESLCELSQCMELVNAVR